MICLTLKGVFIHHLFSPSWCVYANYFLFFISILAFYIFLHLWLSLWSCVFVFFPFISLLPSLLKCLFCGCIFPSTSLFFGISPLSLLLSPFRFSFYVSVLVWCNSVYFFRVYFPTPCNLKKIIPLSVLLAVFMFWL